MSANNWASNGFVPISLPGSETWYRKLPFGSEIASGFEGLSGTPHLKWG